MKKPVSISILGDICPDWGFRESFDEGDVDVVFGDVLPLLYEADIVVGNLECPASDKGSAISKTGPNLRCKPEDLRLLKQAGFDALSLANNHILDYGQEALLDTLECAEKCGLQVFGSGQTPAEVAEPYVVEEGGWRIGFLAFAEEEFNCVNDRHAGANKFDPYVSFGQIADLSAICDYAIVLYHGGIEHYKYPSPLLQKKCRAMADAGANLILCQHSHCIGTMEEHGSSFILYGQGNAIFGKHEGDDAWNQGLLVQVLLEEGADPKVGLRVFEAGETGISLLAEVEEAARLEKLYGDSAVLKDEAIIRRKWDAFCEQQKAMYLPMLFARGRVFNKLNRLSGNALIRLFAGAKKQRIAMNLIRCDAHREVCQTILENEVRP